MSLLIQVVSGSVSVNGEGDLMILRLIVLMVRIMLRMLGVMYIYVRSCTCDHPQMMILDDYTGERHPSNGLWCSRKCITATTQSYVYNITIVSMISSEMHSNELHMTYLTNYSLLLLCFYLNQ